MKNINLFNPFKQNGPRLAKFCCLLETWKAEKRFQTKNF